MMPDWQPHFKSFSPFRVWQQETLNDRILYVRAAHYVGSNPFLFNLRINDTLGKKTFDFHIFKPKTTDFSDVFCYLGHG